MAMNNTLAKHAFITGEYYLIEIDTVLKCYQDAGFNIENEDEEVPNILEIEGQGCFFTGDLIRRGEKYYEIVIPAKDFKWDEVESDDDEDDLDD